MELKKPSWRLITAGIVAVVADILQWVLVPFFTPLGILDPVNDVINFVTAGILVSLLGFHFVFLPAALGKLVPLADMMPLWSGAVFFVAMGKEGLLPTMTNPPGQTALPLSAMGQMPAALPPATAPQAASASVDSQTARAMNPHFREIEH